LQSPSPKIKRRVQCSAAAALSLSQHTQFAMSLACLTSGPGASIWAHLLLKSVWQCGSGCFSNNFLCRNACQ